jgi:hypothetical protein
MWNYINIWVERLAAMCTCGWLTHSIAVISAKAEIQALNGIARLARDLKS